ncbi:MAG: ABC transporter permease subunit [Betaproteobacteria bacterium]|nr:ABC transporter permease subunit [Betaproteobacteria bacterium]
MNAPPRLHDPAAPARLGALLTAGIILWPLLELVQFNPMTLADGRNVMVIGNFLGAFLPPASDREFLFLLGRAAIETLAIATSGMLFALVIGVPLAMLATRALSISSIGPSTRQGLGSAIRVGVRAVLTVLRGIPELVWALIFVRVFGLGPTAGVLALGLTYGGMLAKVYAEILESGDTRNSRALLEAGAGRSAALVYGLVPGAAQELVSYTVYRWECAVRASVVMGFVGAGGLGQLMDQAMKMLNGGEAASILLVFLALVMTADALSNYLRTRVANSGTSGSLAGVGFPGARLAAAVLVCVVASFIYLQLGLAELFTLDALRLTGEFIARFMSPDLSMVWLAKIGWGSLETLAISLFGTILAVLTGMVLSLPASGRYGDAARSATRFVLNALRSVPELVWATITVLAAGLGPFAGALALALHTSGVLGRLFAESLENAPPGPAMALREAGAGRLTAWYYGTLPAISPQLVAYSLYRWEMNIRMAAVLGFVGAGGLGQLLYVELSLFHHAQASSVIAAMLILSIVVDAASAAIRKQMS